MRSEYDRVERTNLAFLSKENLMTMPEGLGWDFGIIIRVLGRRVIAHGVYQGNYVVQHFAIALSQIRTAI